MPPVSAREFFRPAVLWGVVVAAAVSACELPTVTDKYARLEDARRARAMAFDAAQTGTPDLGIPPATAGSGGTSGGNSGAAGMTGTGGAGTGGQQADAAPPRDMGGAVADARPVDAAPPAMMMCTAPPAAADMVSDFGAMTGNIEVMAVGGRGPTNWSVVGDGSAGMGTVTAQAIPGGRCGSSFGLKFAGANYSTWGALTRASFRPMSQPYDGSAYTALRFFARGDGVATVGVKIADVFTSSTGRMCMKCGDHFGNDITVGPNWQMYTLPFAMMKQGGSGDPRPSLTAAQLLHIEFVVGKNLAFELWLDDISLVK